MDRRGDADPVLTHAFDLGNLQLLALDHALETSLGAYAIGIRPEWQRVSQDILGAPAEHALSFVIPAADAPLLILDDNGHGREVGQRLQPLKLLDTGYRRVIHSR